MLYIRVGKKPTEGNYKEVRISTSPDDAFRAGWRKLPELNSGSFHNQKKRKKKKKKDINYVQKFLSVGWIYYVM